MKMYSIQDLKNAMHTALKNDIVISFETLENDCIILSSYAIDDIYNTTYYMIDGRMNRDETYHHTKKQDQISYRILKIVSSLLLLHRKEVEMIINNYDTKFKMLFYLKEGPAGGGELKMEVTSRLPWIEKKMLTVESDVLRYED